MLKALWLWLWLWLWWKNKIQIRSFNSTVQCIIFPIQVKYVSGWLAEVTSTIEDHSGVYNIRCRIYWETNLMNETRRIAVILNDQFICCKFTKSLPIFYFGPYGRIREVRKVNYKLLLSFFFHLFIGKFLIFQLSFLLC